MNWNQLKEFLKLSKSFYKRILLALVIWLFLPFPMLMNIKGQEVWTLGLHPYVMAELPIYSQLEFLLLDAQPIFSFLSITLGFQTVLIMMHLPGLTIRESFLFKLILFNILSFIVSYVIAAAIIFLFNGRMRTKTATYQNNLKFSGVQDVPRP